MTVYLNMTSDEPQYEVMSESIVGVSCVEVYAVYCGGLGESSSAPAIASIGQLLIIAYNSFSYNPPE